MSFQYDTKNQSFRQIMGNGLKYKVPRFQRDYSWGEEQWDDLWQDILGIQESLSADHYMGYLVLKSSNNKNFIIIDGQQRLTTISILILSALAKLQELIDQNKEPEQNKKRKQALIHSFIGFVDPVSLSSENKITLNRNNSAYFRDYLCQFKAPPQRKIKASERLLGLAFEYFTKQINQESHLNNGQAIAEFIESLSDRLVFTTITVANETNAYIVFETLNARGVQLSTPDLVKNYVFSLIDPQGQLHETALSQLEERWEEITRQLGRHSFSDFIRADWNSKKPLTRKSDLFKKIKTELDNKEKANQYLYDLRESAEIYAALKDENDEFWKRVKDGQYYKKKLLLSLKTLNLFNIINPQSALIAGFKKFSVEDFLKFLSYVETVSFRYNVIAGRRHQESIYSEIVRIINSSEGSLAKVRLALKQIYLDDEGFIHFFKDKSLKTQKTHKKARYILKRIEQHINPEISLEDSSLTLEHILPKNPSSQWRKDFETEEELDNCANLIGNMTLLTETNNKNLGTAGFKKKKELFNNSKLYITKQIAKADIWNKKSILERQKWLAEQAKNIWRISF